MTASFATTRNGTRLAYRLRGGSPGGQRLVLIHSLALSAAFWDGVVAHLPEDVHVLTYDCLGHGASDKPAGPYRVEQFADDLSDLMDVIGWQRATVAGCSMGGSVALAFGIGHANRTNALGLIDTTANYGPEAPAQWAERAAQARDKGLASLLAFQRTRWVSDAFREREPAVLDRLGAIFTANDVDAYAASCEMLGVFDLRAGLPAIAVPTAILVGEEDYATPPGMAAVLHAGIKDSTMTVMPRVRHLSPVEVPERIAAALTELLSKSKS